MGVRLCIRAHAFVRAFVHLCVRACARACFCASAHARACVRARRGDDYDIALFANKPITFLKRISSPATSKDRTLHAAAFKVDGVIYILAHLRESAFHSIACERDGIVTADAEPAI